MSRQMQRLVHDARPGDSLIFHFSGSFPSDSGQASSPRDSIVLHASKELCCVWAPLRLVFSDPSTERFLTPHYSGGFRAPAHSSMLPHRQLGQDCWT